MTPFETLFDKYIEDRLTPDELALFREMAAREENRAEFNRLLAAWINRDLSTILPEDINVQELYSELIHRHDIPFAAPPVTNFRRSRIRRFRLPLAAASFILLIGLFLIIRLKTRQTQTPQIIQTAATQTPIHVGNKATLRLANGSTIVLDSAVNGQLALQGNTHILKLANGQLAYQIQARTISPNDPPLYNEMVTPRGGFYQLTLSDGSKVWLDASSSLRFPSAFVGKDRQVEITGEAYFEIVADKDHPFVINANGVKVNVLGTKFNVMAYSDEDAVRTTLVSGAVEVVHENEKIQIDPGQQASWVRTGNKLELSKPNMQQVLAWKEGEFRFEGLKIPAIMRQIARWYDVDIEFKGPLPKAEFNGIIPRKKDVEDLLTVLEQTDEVHFTLQGRKVIVEAGAKQL